MQSHMVEREGERRSRTPSGLKVIGLGHALVIKTIIGDDFLS